MFPLRLVPHDTKISVMAHYRVAFGISGLLIAASILAFLVVGLNFGIDFKGGTLIEIQTKDGPADISRLRSLIAEANVGDTEIQEFGAPNDVLIRVEEQAGGEEAQQAVIARIKEVLGDSVTYRRVEVVGPKVSSELAQTGAIAVFAAIFAVLIYIWFRFEWQFAIGAIAALVHDVVLTIGLFSVLQLEFGLAIIAAILTIVGYSLNDTVVVFDRVRENLRKFKKLTLAEVLNKSINETLSRTVMTSVTTLLALTSLYVLGGDVIRGFVFAMI